MTKLSGRLRFAGYIRERPRLTVWRLIRKLRKARQFGGLLAPSIDGGASSNRHSAELGGMRQFACESRLSREVTGNDYAASQAVVPPKRECPEAATASVSRAIA